MRMQLFELDRAIIEEMAARPGFPPDWQTMDDLADAGRAAVDHLRAERARRGGDGSPLARLSARIDAGVRTDQLEHMDKDELPERVRHRLVRRLHWFNRTVFSYHRFVRMLRPVIEEVARREGRPARVLELASGSGALAMTLAALAERHGLPVQITASDIIGKAVDAANCEAARRGLHLRFRQLNAFDLLDGLTVGDYDIVMIAQATHHFDAGQLAMVIAQARMAGARWFISIDGRRSLRTLVLMPPVAGLLGGRLMFEDALTSARKFYSDSELALIARLAAPDARREIEVFEPGFTMLRVKF